MPKFSEGDLRSYSLNLHGLAEKVAGKNARTRTLRLLKVVRIMRDVSEYAYSPIT
jgi:hypothetical protein